MKKEITKYIFWGVIALIVVVIIIDVVKDLF